MCAGLVLKAALLHPAYTAATAAAAAAPLLLLQAQWLAIQC